MKYKNYLTWLHDLIAAGYDRGYFLFQKTPPIKEPETTKILYLLYRHDIMPIDAIDFLIRRHPDKVFKQQLELFNIKSKRNDRHTNY